MGRCATARCQRRRRGPTIAILRPDLGLGVRVRPFCHSASWRASHCTHLPTDIQTFCINDNNTPSSPYSLCEASPHWPPTPPLSLSLSLSLSRPGAPRGQTESGGIVPRSFARARAPRGGVTVWPDSALCLTTFIHFLIVNKTSLSLSLAPYVRRPFPSKETRRISERDDPGPPVVPGGQGIGLGSRTLERAGRWLGRTGDGLGPLVCCGNACHKAKRRVGV